MQHQILTIEDIVKVSLGKVKTVNGFGHLEPCLLTYSPLPSDLYTIDPTYALKAWELAHYYGYNYTGQADFNDLTCLKVLPMCVEKKTDLREESDKCQRHSENQYPKTNRTISAPSQSLGINGWVDAGCVEVELSNGTYIGVRGLISQQDLISIGNELELSVFSQLNETLLHRGEGNTSLFDILTMRTPSGGNQSVVTSFAPERDPILQASFNSSTSFLPVNLANIVDDMRVPTITGSRYEMMALTSGLMVLGIFRLRRKLRHGLRRANTYS